MTNQNDVTTENIQNLIGWLQAILKETQESRSATLEMRDKVNLIAGIKDNLSQTGQNSGVAERKIDETRSYLEGRLNHIESTLADLRHMIDDVKNKIDHIR